MPRKVPNTIRNDLTGREFGDLTVKGFAGYRKGVGTHPMWFARCGVCGRIETFYGTNLVSGSSERCNRCRKTR